MDKFDIPWLKAAALDWSDSGGTYSITIDLSVYSIEAVLKTCYLFLDQCYLFVESGSEPVNSLKVYFSLQPGISDEIEQIIGEFSNRLLWQEVRQKVAAETQEIREAIVRQAFTEAGLGSESLMEADYNLDPAGIAQ
jgi:His-Xaa-Ser system protein HxsD